MTRQGMQPTVLYMKQDMYGLQIRPDTHKHTELGEYVGRIKGDTVNFMTTWDTVGASCEGAGVREGVEGKLKKPRSESSCERGRKMEKGRGRKKRKREVESSNRMLMDRDRH